MSKLNPLSIEITEAKAWARNWQIACPNNCKAFLMPVDDLLVCLEEMGVLQSEGSGKYTLNNVDQSGVRAYMAIDPNEKRGGGEKLLLVATQKDSDGIHRDIIRGEIIDKDGVEAGLDVQASNLIGSGVYDFTDPCPSECDPNSPLI